MASDGLVGYYPGSFENPHVEIKTFVGGWWIEPLPGEANNAITYTPLEASPPADDTIGHLGRSSLRAS